MLPHHPLITEAIDEIKDGEKLPPLVDIAAGRRRRSAVRPRRLARPPAAARISRSPICSSRSIWRRNHPLALMSLADLYEAMKKPELAIKVYERVPANSPLKRNAEIQLRASISTRSTAPTRPRRFSRS